MSFLSWGIQFTDMIGEASVTVFWYEVTGYGKIPLGGSCIFSTEEKALLAYHDIWDSLSAFLLWKRFSVAVRNIAVR